MDDPTAPLPHELVGGLDERVLSTLQGLKGRVAFSGLRRVLRAHPESLSRSLRRLEREGRIERSDGGYRLLEPAPGVRRPEDSELRPVAHVSLPPGASAEAMLGRLMGRWFGSLRWVGVVSGPEGRLLAWARRDGTGYVMLGIHRGMLRVYVRASRMDDDLGDSEDSAYELLVHAVEAIRPPGANSPSSVTLLSSAPEWPEAALDN